jgi:hypothetical protein
MLCYESHVSELNEFKHILANQKLVELAKKMDEVNPNQKEAIGGSDLFEIYLNQFLSLSYFITINSLKSCQRKLL